MTPSQSSSSRDPSLPAAWRATAIVLSLFWLSSMIGFMVIGFGGYANNLSGLAGILVALASLIVLALLRNLGKIVAGEFDAPGDWEVKLAVAGALMLLTAWVLHFTS